MDGGILSDEIDFSCEDIAIIVWLVNTRFEIVVGNLTSGMVGRWWKEEREKEGRKRRRRGKRKGESIGG